MTSPGHLTIRPPATQAHYRELVEFLTKEVPQNWVIADFPDVGSKAFPAGQLAGAWHHNDLVAAAFFGPLAEQANQFARGAYGVDTALVRDTRQWMLTKLVTIHLLITHPSHRRHGLASSLIDYIEGVCTHHGVDILVASCATGASKQLFTQANYHLGSPGVPLMLHARQPHGSTPLLGIAGGKGTTYAIKKLSRTHHFTVTAD